MKPPEDAPERGERIAKFLARAGIASRRDAERLIAEGKVRCNNAPVTHPTSPLARPASSASAQALSTAASP